MHVIPFKGRNQSAHYDLNLLLNNNKVYVMDNHLAAIWCWLQKISQTESYNFFHIDRHYDLLESQMEWWYETLVEQGVDLSAISVEELRALRYSPKNGPTKDKFPIFRCDNYLSLFYRLYPELINLSYFATHEDGDKFDDIELTEKTIYELPDNIAYWINQHDTKKWIVNIDIDYFFTDFDEHPYQFLTDEYVSKLGQEINKCIDNIEVITIALSPEWCGGWDNAIRVSRILVNQLNIPWDNDI